MITADDLRIVPIFAELADDDYAFLASICEEREYGPGQALAAQGEPADTMWIILGGEVQYGQEGMVEGRVVRSEIGGLTGLLPFSRMVTYVGTVRALDHTRAATINRAHFPEMLRRVPVLEGRLVGALTDRVRETTRAEQQRDKLMALGRLSAGLAHEMNNPAAALRRGTAHLRERLRSLPRRTVSLAGCNLNIAQFSTLAALHARKTGPERPPRLPPLEASEREEAMGAWLEERGVDESWVLAETFVAAGVDMAEMDAIAAMLPPASLADAVAWLGSGLEAELLLREMEDASTRIAQLVSSVKTYSHMDEAQVRGETDVREGLESTLTMLSYKISQRNARVERDYDPDLPHPWANPGELNQVWTNLLDNALDAISPGGRISIRTMRRADDVVVEIRDDGSGIPAETQARIWEPFFTTKDVGEGSGLGLDIARRIIVRQHGGRIGVESRPGDTCFRVQIPIQPDGAS